MEDASDAELWARARDDDRDAYAVLYRRHTHAVLTYAFHRTGDHATAEDLVSVAFLETWRRRGAIELHTESLLPWLYGTVNNLLRHQARTRFRYGRALSRLHRSDDPSDPTADVVEQLAAEQRMKAVLAAMRDLTVVEQEVIALCVWAGLSYQEAAASMQVPVGTVRSRLNRARERLRDMTAPDGDGDR